jgi:hypothetical protein
MKRIVLLLTVLAALASGGCSTLKSVFGPSPAPVQEPAPAVKPPLPAPAPPAATPAQQLNKAKELIRDDNDGAARKLLLGIGAGKSIAGVTDEALYHLGFLTLKGESEASGYPQTRQIMERLIDTYPESVWAMEATALMDLIAKVRRQIKTLKESNMSLMRENKELRLNIDKLKSLDMELEQKSRR